MESVGDRNNDGISDIVVSAPFAHGEDSEGSTGKIYLIKGLSQNNQNYSLF